jgi:hypothetical protein
MSVPGSITTGISTRHYYLQQAMMDHMDLFLTGWWIIFFGILALLIGRFAVIQIYKNRNILKLESDYLVDTSHADSSKTNWFFYKEINGDVALRLFGGAILIGFLFIFAGWQMDSSTTLTGIEKNQSLCWPFFQSCQDFIFLETLPYGYSQTIVYMVLFGIVFLGAYALLSRKMGLAHICIGILFTAKMYFTLINYDFNGNYDYYHTAFTFVYLFLPYKRFFGSFCVAFFYFLSTATKIHEGWLTGTYFSSLQTGLPIFPDETLPVWTGLVIFMEMVGVWFLFSRYKILQRITVTFFIAFHLYSGILVGFFYPIIVLPSVIIFFGPLFKPFKYVPITGKSLLGWGFMLCLLGMQMVSHVIPGDEKYTMEGNFYGLYMFEANHQCNVVVGSEDVGIAYEISTKNARSRCDIYEYWFRFTRQFCTDNNHQLYSFRIDHSINGGPFYEIVTESDLCSLKYNAFTKNDWIKLPEYAEITGVSDTKNFYR